MAFAGLVSVDLASPLSLLLTTFLLSATWSVNSPAWLAILPSLVPKADLTGAIAANGVAYNLSRTIGPTLGGFAIAHYGLSAPYWVVRGAERRRDRGARSGGARRRRRPRPCRRSA